MAGAAILESAPVPEVFALEEVRPGQRGYGLSVFSGFEPERFEVEVLGVWHNTAPDTSYILARLEGRGLEESGVVAGMSGSPVYLDGRLAGAVSFSWPFSLRPIAGITPIEKMRELSRAAGGGDPSAAVMPTLPLSTLASTDLPMELLEQQLAMLERAPMPGAGLGVVWSAFGFGARSRELLASSLGNLAPAGRTEQGVETTLLAGSSVAGVLVDGDLQLAATGTVTERRGDEVLAFGHPFMGIGPVQLPMATAEVITVLSNQLNSFKLANLGPIVGAFDLDRMNGVRGLIGRQAPMTPMKVTVRGEQYREFHLGLARLPSVTPVLVAISALGSLEAATQASGNQGLDLRTRFDLDSLGELEILQSFDGEAAGFQAALYLLAYTGYLLNNSLAEVELKAIEVELEQHRLPRIARLVEAHASRTLVRPGEKIELNLDMVPYRGDRQRRSLDVEVPTSLPEGRYSLLVGDGVSIDVARLSIERSEPVTFAQALALLRSFHSRRELVVLGVYRGSGLAVAGEVLPRLPGSVWSIWGAAASSSAIPLQLTVAQQQEMTLDIPLAGAIRVDLEVRREDPLSLEGGEPAAPAADGSSDDGESSSTEAISSSRVDRGSQEKPQ